ncbi:MAG: 2'-5' RNA ligase family protein [Deltaproteobacteria bacterium]
MPRETSIDLHFPSLGRLLEPWRSASVAVATKGVPPHVSLLYPWRPPPLSSQDLAALRSAVADCPMFSIQFARVGRFSSSVLFLEPTRDAPLGELMRRIQEAFPDTPPYGGSFSDPTPHLTIAKAQTESELARLEREITLALVPHLPLTLRVEHIVVMEEGVAGEWHEVEIVRLLA